MSKTIDQRTRFTNASSDDSLLRGLACAALNPGLRSILVFDGTISTLQSAAQTLSPMLEQVTGCKVVTVQLGVIETEEDLWGGLALRYQQPDQPFEWQQGILSGGQNRELRLVLIPDLSRLSLAAARACVMLMEARVAHLERHGQQDIWQPQLCWLAGCSRQDVALVSPHLLDRFALRLSAQALTQTDRLQQIQSWLSDPEPEQTQVSPLPSSEWIERLQQAQSLQPEMTLEAQQRVQDFVALDDNYSVRRELALLRLAQANAQLEGVTRTSVQQVDWAAQMIGLMRVKPDPDAIPSEFVKPDQSAASIQPESDLQPIASEDQTLQPQPSPAPLQEPVYAPDTTETLASQSLAMDGASTNPYPEDSTPTQREAASLRLPFRRFQPTGSGRGTVIGVEPAIALHDLAIVSTLLESAKYQPMRRSALLKRQEVASLDLKTANLNEQFSCGDVPRALILQPSDLRRYRRAVVPEQMLMLVMDYTCLRECQWQAALLPYLQWAYVERANLCLVQVGAANAAQELQAERIIAQNVLVPRISNGLEAGGGQATPLAHGLDLALQTLRHALQHGRSAVRQAVLVVISDGRGNVPLEASRANQKPVKPVNRQGIEDALQVAQQIGGLKQVEAVVLNPQPKYYADLPVKLAQALGAKIAAIPSLKAWEVDG